MRNLIADGKVVLLGTVRQEILSGIKHQAQFEKLRDILRAFPNILTNAEDYELAAEYFNICRRRGIQGSNTDFLICATAKRRNYEINQVICCQTIY
ncbi:MAG: PIN domain-containing protein [Crocosphaera sp.]